MPTDLITMKETCELLHVSRPTVYRYIETHRLTRYKKGKGDENYFARAEVEKLARELNRARPV